MLFTKGSIKKTVKTLGSVLTKKYKDKEVIVLSLLDGSFVFAADLVRQIKGDVDVRFLKIKSYEGTESSGSLVVARDFDFRQLDNKHVLIVDDILDTGLTLNTLCKQIRNETEILSLATCVLLDKQVNRTNNFEADYVGFKVQNEFVVGYGLDYNGKYRNLPFIGVLKEKVYR